MKDLLKIMACGSVDDGKSTLLGHLMYNNGSVFTDQIRELEQLKNANGEIEIDFSLLLDGLEAEREQHITIDVAYRFFRTEKRSFIIADTPGHSEYTRNMAVGASFADLAIILVDASKGISAQTMRHFRICRLMGICDFVFAVNKMDLTGYSSGVFFKIKSDLESKIDISELSSCLMIPVSAKNGDNLNTKSENMEWYDGVPLLCYLDSIVIKQQDESGFIMPVQRVSRFENGDRGYQGSVESGRIAVGDTISVYPSTERSTVTSLLVSGKPSDSASYGQQITLSLKDDIDISRGCVIASKCTPSVTTQFKAEVLWLNDDALDMSKSYFLMIGTEKVPASVIDVDHCVGIIEGKEFKKEEIQKNDIFVCTVSASSAVVTDCFKNHKSIGSFILIDRLTYCTAACGTVIMPLDNNYIYPALTDITSKERAEIKSQTPLTLWLTGLPASGKTSIANALERKLFMLGKHTMILDGDNLRSGINKGLGFSESDRSENIRRTAEIAKLMNDAGLIVIVSLVSPLARDRKNAKNILGSAFKEIYVSAPAEVCEKRDKKEYYKKAKQGLIKNFTGVSGGYEIPASPDIIADSEHNSPEGCADEIINRIKGII